MAKQNIMTSQIKLLNMLLWRVSIKYLRAKILQHWISVSCSTQAEAYVNCFHPVWIKTQFRGKFGANQLQLIRQSLNVRRCVLSLTRCKCTFWLAVTRLPSFPYCGLHLNLSVVHSVRHIDLLSSRSDVKVMIHNSNLKIMYTVFTMRGKWKKTQNHSKCSV